MLDESLPYDRSLPDDDVQHALGDAASSASSARRSAERGVSSAGFRTTVLPHASAGPSFQRGDVEREVPRHDQPDDAERLAQRQVDSAGDGDRLAVVLVDGAGVEVEDVRDHADFAACAGDRLADVARLDLRELLVVLLDERREPPQQPAAVGGGDGAPRRVSRACAGDGSIGLTDPVPRQNRDRLLGRGVNDSEAHAVRFNHARAHSSQSSFGEGPGPGEPSPFWTYSA